MNCGKSRDWFTVAAREHRWPDYIGKMDVDTFVHASKLLSILRDVSTPCEHVFGGKPWMCPPEKKACPPPQCWEDGGGMEFPTRRTGTYDFLQVDNASHPECWHYMQGGFYFMSRQLAQEVTESDEDWRAFDARHDFEDASTGHAITEYARKRAGTCVAGMNIEKTFEHLR